MRNMTLQVRNYNKLLLAALLLGAASTALSTLSWAQNPTVVSTDAEIRAAVQVDNANIQSGFIYTSIGLQNFEPT